MKTVVYEHEISAKTKAMFNKFAHEASRVQWTAGRLAVLRDKGTKEEVASAEAEYAELVKPGVAETEDHSAALRDMELENWERGQSGPSEPRRR